MRAFFVAIAILGFIATAAKAADDSPQSASKLWSSIVGKLPDTEDNLYRVYLFTLKKNGISVRMNGEEFCAATIHGQAVKYPEPVKAADVPKGMKCVERTRDEEIVKLCESVKDGEVTRYMERVKDGRFFKEAVLASRPKVTENQVEVAGDLEWVFCRAKISRSTE
jgi:hypothetical protein